MEKYKRLTTGESYELCSQEYLAKCAEKLEELEDKIENGTLVKLPCKIGDEIYGISNEGIIEENVSAIEIEDNDITIWTNTCYEINPKEIGDIWFFNKKEAEERIKELLQGGNTNVVYGL